MSFENAIFLRNRAFLLLTVRFSLDIMKTHHNEGKQMKTQVSIPVSTSLFLQLAEFLRHNNDPRDPVVVASEAIQYWMDNADFKPELLVESDARGYQWKNVFLPDGTQIRMQYQGSYSYAKVDGDELTYQGSPISPGSLAKTIAGGYNRNAWRDLWIKRPEDREWILADDLRAQSKEVAEKLLEELGAMSNTPKKTQS